MATYNRQNLHANKKKISLSYIIRESEEKYHRSGVNSLQYDSRLDRLYSAGRDSVIRTWSFEQVAQHNHVSRHENNSVRKKCLNRDCNYFIQSLEHHTDWVNDIVLCSNGRNLISVSNDTTIKVWSTHPGYCLSTLKSHKDYAKCLAYAKDREVVASAGLDQMIFLWDIQALTSLTATKNTVTTKPLDGSKNSIYSLAINQTGTLVASGSTEKVIRLWDPRSRQKLLKLRGHTDNVRSLILSKDGSILLSASSDGTIRLWSVPQQRCISIIRVHDEGVWALQTNESFTTVYSGGKDCKVFMTDLKDTSSSTLICEERASVLSLLLVDRYYKNRGVIDNSKMSLWVSTTESSINNWPLMNEDPVESKCSYDEELTKPETYPPTVPSKSLPALIIPGNPAVINYHILNDKRHILTLESDNSMAIYDVLTARLVESYPPAESRAAAKEKFEQEVKNRFKMVYVPNWFTVDLKIGLLCIHLEENECLSAWVWARDYNFVPPDDGQDMKVNLGCLMLQALLEYWSPTYEGYGNDMKSWQHDSSGRLDTTDEPALRGMSQGQRMARNHGGVQRVGARYFTVASHTPVTLHDGNQTIIRLLVCEAVNESEDMYLREFMPQWITDVVINGCLPKLTKVSRDVEDN